MFQDKIYTLYHKNTPVLEYKIEDKYGYPGKITKIYSAKNEPLSIYKNGYPVIECLYETQEKLFNWLSDRSISLSRKNAQKTLKDLGFTDTCELSRQFFYFTLSDQYWAAPSYLNLEWKNLNFFTNDFEEMDFDNSIINEKLKISRSPSGTEKGELPKKWIIDNSKKRILIKGKSQEAVNEVFASEILKRLEIPHVEYKLIESRGQCYSCCECFVDENTDFISAADIYTDCFKPSEQYFDWNRFMERCSNYKIDNVEEPLLKMFVFDYLMANTDRHSNNFGFLRDVDSLNWKGLAPVFDNENSMFKNYSEVSLETKSFEIKCKPFDENPEKMMNKLPIEKVIHKMDFTTLNGIKDYFYEKADPYRVYSEERKNLLMKIFEERIENIKQMAKTKILVVNKKISKKKSSMDDFIGR